ncbi:hypothetical protein H8356DRAFT_1337633 [Neocallimastix lanati (nom. inval.)]|nr:hypothetical protein H8356DRAFT_1337633 [Neocallimastix sp. JGI-2020a]
MLYNLILSVKTIVISIYLCYSSFQNINKEINKSKNVLSYLHIFPFADFRGSMRTKYFYKWTKSNLIINDIIEDFHTIKIKIKNITKFSDVVEIYWFNIATKQGIKVVSKRLSLGSILDLASALMIIWMNGSYSDARSQWRYM